ncbi:Aldo/keto reductase [Thozetella sp. PMI_491]|nr:Aldo/keto reductase [Thozetella sp. PMI_491]
MPPHIVFGAGGIGTTAKGFIYNFDTAEKVNELLTVLQELGINELDSAASYPPTNPWNTETLLGESKAIEKGFIIDSKVLGRRAGGKLTDEGIGISVDKTLHLTGAKKIRTLYVHAPDPQTPLEVTAAGFDSQYKKGKFERLGLCNYSAKELERYFEICEEKGYVKPTVIQDQYNAAYRGPEADIIPLLRKHNCAFYAFSPLAGGFLTGKVTFALDNPESKALDRTRWRGESTMASYPNDFDRPEMHEAIRNLKKVCDSMSPPISLQEASLRWIVNHSALQDGDSIIIGATRIDQLKANTQHARAGPLEKEVLEAVEQMWVSLSQI